MRISDWSSDVCSSDLTEFQMAEDDDFMSEAYAREQREAHAIEAENAKGRAWQEHVAGEPGYAFLSDKEKDGAANRFFDREREAGRLSPTLIIRPETSTSEHRPEETRVGKKGIK